MQRTTKHNYAAVCSNCTRAWFVDAPWKRVGDRCPECRTGILNPDVSPGTNYRRLSAKDSFALLRKELRAEFPGVKFSVRMSRGTAYGMGWVDWTDGPSPERVTRVVRRFVGEGFDGMTDSAVHFHWSACVIGREANGTLLVSGARLINTQRRLSEESRSFLESINPRAIGETEWNYRDRIHRIASATDID